MANHYLSAEWLLTWRLPALGEQMAIADYLDIVMVAGVDLYAYQGVAAIARPHSRPDQEGRCDR